MAAERLGGQHDAGRMPGQEGEADSACLQRINRVLVVLSACVMNLLVARRVSAWSAFMDGTGSVFWRQRAACVVHSCCVLALMITVMSAACMADTLPTPDVGHMDIDHVTLMSLSAARQP